MAKFRFLLLDAGPIIKLFELGLWEIFIEKCDVTITRTVVEQCVHRGQASVFDYIDYPFEESATAGKITIADIGAGVVKAFVDKYELRPRFDIHEGEDEILAFFDNSSEDYTVCAADHVVFRVLGFVGRGERGISLEELMREVGFTGSLEWKYTKKFREKYTALGEQESIQR